jgi:tRNA pseudouridine55 synthase
MSEKLYIIDKKAGQTPLDCIEELKNTHLQLKHVPLTYAGRLDPLAKGVLIILCGDECLKKDEYLALNKEYEVKILFGFSTDTYDVMGKLIMTPSKEGFKRSSDLLEQDLWKERGQTISNPSFDSVTKILQSFTGRFKQAYPPFSSRPVDGKPLFVWARENKLNEIVIPEHEVFVDSIDIIGEEKISGAALSLHIKEMISRVSGDFRQEEILSIWKNNLQDLGEVEFPIIKLRIVCGSGVYVRSIAHELGIALGIPALALEIVRTKVGEYHLDDIEK